MFLFRKRSEFRVLSLATCSISYKSFLKYFRITNQGGLPKTAQPISNYWGDAQKRKIRSSCGISDRHMPRAGQVPTTDSIIPILAPWRLLPGSEGNERRLYEPAVP